MDYVCCTIVYKLCLELLNFLELGNKPIRHVECAGALGQSLDFCH